MTTAGQIDVKLGLNSEEFIQGVSSADSKLKKFQKSLNDLGGDITNKANPAVEMLSGALKKLAGGAIAVTVGKKLVDLGNQAVNTAAKFESLAVSFEVLAGGADAGRALTNQIIQLASKTPLTTEALSDGARTLLSFGESAEEVINDLRLLGDISGGNAQRMQSLTLAFSQIGSTGRLAGQDLLQMVNAGFNPLETMAKKTGKSMAQLKKEMSEGKITFLDVKDAMIAATSEGGRFYGMMNKQSETLDGRLSTLADTWQLVSKNIGDFFLPAAKAAVGALNAIGEAVLNVQNKLKFKTAQNDVKALNSALIYQQEQLSKARTESERKEWETRITQTKEYLKVHQSVIDSFNVDENGKVTSKKATSGFAALSGRGTNEEAVKKAKKQQNELLNISKDYAKQMADIESYETAKNELMGTGGRFQRNYSEKLQILQWYYNERFRIMQAANNNMDIAQEQFNQLEALKNQKLLQTNISDWSDYGNSIKSILSGSFSTLLTTSESFGDTMINLMASIYKSLINLALDAAIKEINIAKWKAAILALFNIGTGGAAGAAVAGVGAATASLETFHSGGLNTSEQLAVIRKDERVLNPAETTAYNSGNSATSTNGVNNIMMFNIKAWDGKDVINTLKSNSNTINQIVASGIKNNNQGLRTTVQNT